MAPLPPSVHAGAGQLSQRMLWIGCARALRPGCLRAQRCKGPGPQQHSPVIALLQPCHTSPVRCECLCVFVCVSAFKCADTGGSAAGAAAGDGGQRGSRSPASNGNVCVRGSAHAHVHSQINKIPHSHSLKHTSKHRHTHTQTQTHSHPDKQTHTHKHTHTHARKHTHSECAYTMVTKTVE